MVLAISLFFLGESNDPTEAKQKVGQNGQPR
jgi:hypothetical protein